MIRLPVITALTRCACSLSHWLVGPPSGSASSADCMEKPVLNISGRITKSAPAACCSCVSKWLRLAAGSCQARSLWISASCRSALSVITFSYITLSFSAAWRRVSSRLAKQKRTRRCAGSGRSLNTDTGIAATPCSRVSHWAMATSSRSGRIAE